MRVALVRWALVVLAVGAGFAVRLDEALLGFTRQSDPTPRVRQAVGTVGSRANIRSLLMRGQRAAGFNAITAKPIESQSVLEIRILRPDNFLVLVQSSEGGPVRRSGFVRNEPTFGQQRSWEDPRIVSDIDVGADEDAETFADA